MLAGAQREMVTPIALRFRDEFSGDAPIGRLTLLLDVQDGSGWRPVDRTPVRTPSGVFAYPNLERHAAPAGLPARRYRIRVEADFYRADHLRNKDGVEFDAFPGNDDVLPSAYATSVTTEVLLPSPRYPFPTHVPVVRGIVADAFGAPVANAVVSQGMLERVLSDERGQYALPLRWVVAGVPTEIDAEDERTGRAGTRLVMLPSSLGVSVNFTIT